MKNTRESEAEFFLYDGAAPGSENWDWEEKASNNNSLGVETVFNLVRPRLAIFRPEKPNGTAVIVCPGGGFHFLAIHHEGNSIAAQLVKNGLTVFVLKYRLFRVSTDNPFDEMFTTPDKDTWDKETYPIIPLAINDARSAIAYVRNNAKHFAVSPDRIGIMGFSAGGLLAASTAFAYGKDNRPDFVAAVYADIPESRQSFLQPDAPPLFIACATDDESGFAMHAISLYSRWYNAKRAVELHLYAKGGHGFGAGISDNTTADWLRHFETWLRIQGLV